jgi:hypothetical protein
MRALSLSIGWIHASCSQAAHCWTDRYHKRDVLIPNRFQLPQLRSGCSDPAALGGQPRHRRRFGAAKTSLLAGLLVWTLRRLMATLRGKANHRSACAGHD